ncbi:hypothetical protein RJT34_04512 [Clitoria ternatea]|uniref:Uncharacterized protein n=1 Tax=Clitoria ternatea TaxID=43366 RepID=A0AAN9Q2Q5_CLITE
METIPKVFCFGTPAPDHHLLYCKTPKLAHKMAMSRLLWLCTILLLWLAVVVEPRSLHATKSNFPLDVDGVFMVGLLLLVLIPIYDVGPDFERVLLLIVGWGFGAHLCGVRRDSSIASGVDKKDLTILRKERRITELSKSLKAKDRVSKILFGVLRKSVTLNMFSIRINSVRRILGCILFVLIISGGSEARPLNPTIVRGMLGLTSNLTATQPIAEEGGNRDTQRLSPGGPDAHHH